MIQNIEGILTQVEENERIYSFPGNWHVNLKDVVELLVRPSGTHRLKTKDGRMHIIPTGWIHIDILSPKSWVV